MKTTCMRALIAFSTGLRRTHARRIALASCGLFLLQVWPIDVAQAQSTCSIVNNVCTLENPKAKYVFNIDPTGNVWLASASLAPHQQEVQFLPTEMWKIQFRTNGANAGKIDVVPFSNTMTPTCLTSDGDATLEITWSGTQPGFGLHVSVMWTLKGNDDFLEATMDYELTDPPATSYRPWNSRFPRLEIVCLDPDADVPTTGNPVGGNDRLATGSNGGLLYGNPIHWKDSRYPDPVNPDDPSNVMEFSSGTPDALNGRINAFSAEPTHFTVPVVCYYNPDLPGGPLGVYLSNTDDRGHSKGIYLLPERGQTLGGANGSLLYESMAHPSDPTPDGTDYHPGDPDTAHQSIFELTQFFPPYAHHVGVIAGDWVDAAQKYKDFRVNNSSDKFKWLDTKVVGSQTIIPRPSGHPNNPFISPELKANPVQATIGFSSHAGNPGYCVGNLDVGTSGGCSTPSPSKSGAAGLYDWVQSKFGSPPLGYLNFDRFQVAYDEFLLDTGTETGRYVPSGETVMQEARALMAVAAGCGHRLVLDSITEKFGNNGSDVFHASFFRNCPDYDPTETYDYYCAYAGGSAGNYNWKSLAWTASCVTATNGLLPHGSHVTIPPCPAGRSDANQPPYGYICPDPDPNPPDMCIEQPCNDPDPWPSLATGISWLEIFTDAISEAIPALSINGGLRLNAPTIAGRTCFSNVHDHPPGFGPFAYDAWKQTIETIESKASLPDFVPAPPPDNEIEGDFFVISEYGGSTMAQYVRVQNPLSNDLRTDFRNLYPTTTPLDPCQLLRFYDAPVRVIPLMQMVCDEIRYASQYPQETLSLPYTSSGDPFGYFSAFPAVPAALACFSQARSVLAHQSMIKIETADIVDLELFEGLPMGNNLRRAAQGMLAFYQGLRHFLSWTDGTRSNMTYHTGSMERPIVLSIGPPQTEHFKLPTAPFPALEEVLDVNAPGRTCPGCPPCPPENPNCGCELLVYPGLYEHAIDLSQYRAIHSVLFGSGNLHVPMVPDEHESWLPHGTYRHWDHDTTSIALLIANPWGVTTRHVVPAPGGGVTTLTKPMNPFTFNFASIPQSPAVNTYSYAFQFDPAEYGISNAYTVTRKTWNAVGTVTETTDLGTMGAGQTFNGSGSLVQFGFQAYYFDEN